ncbi:MAG: Rha family transcriptional regulator [Tannerella sp.]|jgi:Rha family phage regulatory protein|nr:Rha family transcriptional regulator [Tannerella sp.]
MKALVKMQRDQPMTTSLLVAERFGKQHRDVLKAIRNLTAQNCAVKKMFVESNLLNGRKQKQPMYLMNRDGFALLVMGFTGPQALAFKLEFIEAFNRMEMELKNKNKELNDHAFKSLVEMVFHLLNKR